MQTYATATGQTVDVIAHGPDYHVFYGPAGRATVSRREHRSFHGQYPVPVDYVMHMRAVGHIYKTEEDARFAAECAVTGRPIP